MGRSYPLPPVKGYSLLADLIGPGTDGNRSTGNHLPFGSKVKVVSQFTPEELIMQFKTMLLKKNTRRIAQRGDTPAQEYLGPDRDEIDQDEVNRLWWSSYRQQLPWPVGPLLNHGTGEFISLLFGLAGYDHLGVQVGPSGWMYCNSVRY